MKEVASTLAIFSVFALIWFNTQMIQNVNLGMQ